MPTSATGLVIFRERRLRRGARPVALAGTFLGLDIGLGELMTDGEGRLVVLPGPGGAYSKGGNALTNFAGNDGWADDVCDGPVHATVKIDGRTIEADPAWVLVTPPNYAPGMSTGLVTLYDAVRSMFVASGQLTQAGWLRRRHLPDLRSDDGHAVGQRGLLHEQRIRQ
jgi:hypothetical protein